MEKLILEQLMNISGQIGGIEQQIVYLKNEMNERFEKQDKKLDEHSKKFEEIDKKLDEHSKKFEEIDKKLDEHSKKFEEIDKKFEEIDKKFEKIDKKFGEIDKKFGEIDKKFGEIDKKFGEIDKNLKEHSNKYIEQNRKIDSLICKQDEIRFEIKKQNNNLKKLDEKLNLNLDDTASIIHDFMQNVSKEQARIIKSINNKEL